MHAGRWVEVDAGLSPGIAKLISSPILNLVETAGSISAQQNFEKHAVKQSGDELGNPIGSFNEMLSQVQRRDRALSRPGDRLLATNARLAEATESAESADDARRARSQFLAKL